jgi:hypothetical protein
MRNVSLYHRHCFPAEVISHCVWLYFRFSLSFRDVEELMSSRGVALSYETVREWCFKFGVRLTPTVCAADLLGRVTGGTWMRCSSKSTDVSITFGGQWIRMATYWIFWSRVRGQEGSQEVL